MAEERKSGGRRGLVAAALSAAAVAVAVPVGGALASGEPTPTQAQDQQSPREHSPRHDDDCPKKDGRGGSDASVEL